MAVKRGGGIACLVVLLLLAATSAPRSAAAKAAKKAKAAAAAAPTDSGSSTTTPPADCEAKGFAGPSCADCGLFSEIVRDAELAADCKRCCVRDAGGVKYAKAVLELCPYKKSGLPQVEEFLKKHRAAFGKRLTVRQVVGAYPRLVLSNPSGGGGAEGEDGGGAEGRKKESVRVDNWRAATFVEFLNDRLLPAPAAEPPPAS